ncbi:antitoxin HicB [Candidatus Poriferisocius sp.]|uniref:antitoxin HicB n=1 Tax=Candidatus Poriferisocius sp. TaxID=3101276 RepID=UPI003B02B5B9
MSTMVIDQYRFWTEWSEEDGEWVGLCDGFPLVSWVEPDQEAAESGIRAVVAEDIEDLVAEAKPLPKPGVEWPPQTLAPKDPRPQQSAPPSARL